jgi:hypothetical protein
MIKTKICTLRFNDQEMIFLEIKILMFRCASLFKVTIVCRTFNRLRKGRRTFNRLRRGRRTFNRLRNFEHFIISMGYNIVHQKFKVLFINSYRRSFHTNKIYN